VSVNAGTDVWVDRHGSMTRAGSIDPSELALLVERAIAPLGLRFDRSSPIVDARLPHGHRLCAVMPPLAIDGLCVSIRRFALRHATLEAFAPAEVCRLLIALVGERCNIVVSGGTSSGKTTLLNALAAYTLPHERLITIEDTAELELQCPHVLRLESRPATPDGVEAVTVRQLLKAALRLRPDRIVVGEVRGAEAFDMVQALNTGHDGSLSTVHANSPADALRRIVSLAELGAPGQSPLLLEEQVHSSIDIIVHLVRRQDGSRHIAAVSEVLPGAASGAPTRLLADANGVVDTPRRGRVTTDGHTP
jgi:pilus assembly protein CpaF